MPAIRILFLWHMHQPFYKDLVTGEYRLPWVRLHALKDYYGMVKLLDEFPNVHQTFNLVPSLIAQIEDYVAGTARDPFLDVASKAADSLSPEDRRFALRYLFQANVDNLIDRYPRYKELYEQFAASDFDPAKAEPNFSTQDIADLQVLSQIAWFDEFFIEGEHADPEIQALIAKGRGYDAADQQIVLTKSREILASVLPAYASAAQRGLIELSTSPYYHPILPLLCDTDLAGVSSPGLPLPRTRFTHPEDAAEQLQRGLLLHERAFGIRPRGVWPSEGSISDEVVDIAHSLGVHWMATDEGVLGRSADTYFERTRDGRLHPEGAAKLYNIYRYQQKNGDMHLVFRDHSLSDLIGFVYSGMPPAQAAEHFIHQLKESAQAIVNQGKNAIVPVILDGENAWEFFPKSGREFLRHLYRAIQADPQLEALTISEAIERHQPDDFGTLSHLVPGSWINSNFNVWIGAPEDNRAWDYLTAARDFFSANASAVSPEQRDLAHEELLIAEGSDWNWWYGPEHHSANDADFDELYRKHLSNVYQALGSAPPEYLAQPISRSQAGARFVEQTAYVTPRIDGEATGYFDWIGAAHYSGDRRNSAMHGKKFLLDSAYAGMDNEFLYTRLDFSDDAFSQLGSSANTPDLLIADFNLMLTIEKDEKAEPANVPSGDLLQLDIRVRAGKLVAWELKEPDVAGNLSTNGHGAAAPDYQQGITVCLGKVLEARIPLDYLNLKIGKSIEIRFSLWKDNLPVDALPAEGSIRLKRMTEHELAISGDYWKA
ncbi:MAG: glycoside hydrolase, family 57 [Acidobacteriaceae bacterium]|nr:glycoside hydrolase, family 57 [Acidobacteriaceae bacterium]